MNLRPTNETERKENGGYMPPYDETLPHFQKITECVVAVRENPPKKPKLINPDDYLDDFEGQEPYNGPGYDWMTEEEKQKVSGEKELYSMNYKEITYNILKEVREIKSCLLDIKEVLSQRGN